nr:MAG TPA: hypothetical protein [Caudoviricetes sp.]
MFLLIYLSQILCFRHPTLYLLKVALDIRITYITKNCDFFSFSTPMYEF